MEQTPYTPGPWEAEEDLVFSANGLRIADCFCDGQPMTEGEAEANARLIAAAPVLLEALELAISALNDTPNFRTRCPDPACPPRTLSSYQLLPRLEAVARHARRPT